MLRSFERNLVLMIAADGRRPLPQRPGDYRRDVRCESIRDYGNFEAASPKAQCRREADDARTDHDDPADSIR